MDADQRVYAAVGCHPHFAPMWNESVKDRIINMLDYSPRCVAWGEMGLDYNCQGGRSPDRDQQRVVFGLQLQAAVRRDLPIVIHGREAMDDIIKVMLDYVPNNYPTIHLHCCTTSFESLQQFQEEFPNAKFGFTNKLTRKGTEGEELRRTIKLLPLHKILTETDAPYHPPTGWELPEDSPWRRPTRGSLISHPGMVKAVVKTIAQVKKIPIYQVAQATYGNACSVYRL